ncbi:MAG: hypothetical protein Q8S84_09120 [bacterium]|nr:hypothetical protein [bacterium]
MLFFDFLANGHISIQSSIKSLSLTINFLNGSFSVEIFSISLFVKTVLIAHFKLLQGIYTLQTDLIKLCIINCDI